ncbi:MAG: hypothetical protein RBU37_19080, partial [Myxococcota bacterium]|nr:hypothetical protein [Myxococcota bacterium]
MSRASRYRMLRLRALLISSLLAVMAYALSSCAAAPKSMAPAEQSAYGGGATQAKPAVPSQPPYA